MMRKREIKVIWKSNRRKEIYSRSGGVVVFGRELGIALDLAIGAWRACILWLECVLETCCWELLLVLEWRVGFFAGAWEGLGEEDGDDVLGFGLTSRLPLEWEE